MSHKVIYALDENKNIVSITDTLDKKEKLFCPCCGVKVLFVKGIKNKHHFRHENDYEHKGESDIY